MLDLCCNTGGFAVYAAARGASEVVGIDIDAAVLEIAKGAGGSGFREGSGKATFPANAVHSFSGGHNRIAWVLKVHGDVPFWPDVEEEFEIEVAPRPAGGAA